MHKRTVNNIDIVSNPLSVDLFSKAMMHFGKYFHRVRKAKDRGPTWIGSKIKKSRNNVLNIEQREAPTLDIVWDISVALEFDFFKAYSEALNKVFEERGDTLGEPDVPYVKANRQTVTLTIENGQIMNTHIENED